MSDDLLLCALRRSRGPMTAATVADVATGLALDAGYEPKDVPNNAKRVAAQLKRLADAGVVARAGSVTDNGREVPTWALADGSFDAHAPVPEPEQERAPLNGQQTRAVLDAQDRFLVELNQQRREHADMRARHAREEDDLIDTHRRRLRNLVESTDAQLRTAGLIE